MRLVRALCRNCSAAAAVEMALVTPLLLIMLAGGLEVGNYFMDEHILVKAVRDGARYAARQNFNAYAGCTSTPSNLANNVYGNAAFANTKLLVRKATLDSTVPNLLSGWDDGTMVFTVQMKCYTTLGGAATGGIYNGNNTGTAGQAARVIVTAKLPYRPVMPGFKFKSSGYFLNASQQAAVTGI